jgi:DNA-binding MarR family transcriptional regulator
MDAIDAYVKGAERALLGGLGYSSMIRGALEDAGVGVGQWRALHHISDRKPIAIGTLAECMDISKQSLSRLLDELDAKGLLDREEAPDRRSVLLTLSDEGERVQIELYARFRQIARGFAMCDLLTAIEHEPSMVTNVVRFIPETV